MADDITDFVEEIILADEGATLKCAEQFAKILVPGLVVYLHGDLGAGKTTFVRGVLQSLGYIGKVKSPTYTLVETYTFETYALKSHKIKPNVISSYNIYHFDLYRFIDAEEWEAAGFREYFNPQSICMIEWPEKAGHLLPEPDIHVCIAHNNLARKIKFKAASILAFKRLQENIK